LAEGDSTAPPTPPSSEPVGRKKLVVLVIVAVVIVAALAAVVYVLTTGPAPQPPTIGLDYVTVTSLGGKTSADQGELLTLTATAVDTEGTDVTATTTTFAWSASPSNAVAIRASAVPYTVRIFGLLAQAVTVTANATHNTTSKQATLQLTITPVHFDIVGPGEVAEVGTPFLVTVTALRADSSAAAGYRGTVHFTSDDAGATLPSDYTFNAGDPGSHIFPAATNVSRAGIVGITVQDTLASITGTMSIRGNHAPVAGMTATANPADQQEVIVDGTSSSDADGDALTYAWDFGDSTPRVTTPTATHRYAIPSTYPISLTATDVYGASDSANQTFRAKAPPTAVFTVPQWTSFGSSINATVDASGSTDPDGTIVSYDWAWGDTLTTTVTTAVTTHTYAASYDGQTVTITLTVTDNDGLTNTASLSVLVTLQLLPPFADFTFTIDQDTRTVSVDATPPISSDPNGNIAFFNWSWGDGAYTNGTSPTASHAYGASGNFVVNLTVEDTTNLKGWAEKTVQIQQPNLAPTAVFSVTRNLMQVSADASASTDPNGNIASYNFDWGDGATTGPQASAFASHTYAIPGLKTITLTVIDSTSLMGITTRRVSVNTSTIDYTYYDFFNVPYGEWWDWRFATYGDLPINADCFNATSIADGVCTPSNAAIPDYETYPYTNWYPLPGNLNYNAASNNPMIYAPYRFRATGVDVPGYNRSEPVFLPVLNYNQPAGSRLDFDWQMDYLDKATGDALTAYGCPSVDPASYDGFYLRNQITLTMDLQESKRLFNVVGTDQASAQNWWNTNANPACGLMGPVETNVRNWFLAMAGGGSGSASVGKYDIANSYEWYYVSSYLQINATVDPDGTTHILIDHAATGTEVMLARMFYWGNTSYKLNYLDSSNATGWWGMELAWFEGLDFTGSLGAPGGGFDFNLTSAMQYHFQHLSDPGPNGYLDGTDDVPFWTWGPIMSDYTNDYFAQHPASELDRYPVATYVHSTPGGYTYNESLIYDYAPIRWDLAAGQSWHFQFPTGNVVFYDPNLTPVPANPQGGFVPISSPLKYFGSTPASYGDWDPVNLTWDVYGPSITGGPPGTPGADWLPGTADDQYALSSYGAIRLQDPPVGLNLNAAAFLVAKPSTVAGPMIASTVSLALLSPGGTWAAFVGSGPEGTSRRFRA